ncbi:Zn-dependent oligopeptidase [Pseudanabaena biceps]|nr:Zn-dependent oligopeptidase [Pseudanabaena biceps]
MKAEFYYSQRKYECSVISLCIGQENIQELRIRNHEGEILAVQQGKKTALRGKSRATSQEVDILKSNYYNLIKAAVNALELVEKRNLLQDKDEQIRLLNAEISIFREKANLSESEREEIVQLRDQIKTLSDRQSISAFNYDQQETEAKLLKRLGKAA